MAVTDLFILPTQFNQSSIIILDDIIYIDGFTYSIEDYTDAELDADTQREVSRALTGDFPSTTDQEIEQCVELDSFLSQYLTEKVNDYLPYSDEIDLVRDMIIEFKTPLSAFTYCYDYVYDEVMRQVVLNAKNPKIALQWATHIENELAMRDIIIQSENLFIITDYALMIANQTRKEDKELKQIILDESSCERNAHYYLERLQDFKLAEIAQVR